MGKCNFVAYASSLKPSVHLRFKGTDSTFVNFPVRLQHVLSETVDNVVVECIVFPSYETKGELVCLCCLCISEVVE
jgi:hypothetical protein